MSTTTGLGLPEATEPLVVDLAGRHVHLDGAPELLAARIGARTDHFMPSSLLGTQLATLEPLGDDEAGIRLDVAATPDELADAAAAWLRRTASAAQG